MCSAVQPFSVRVAGSSANLGSGFDSLAVALDCWLRVDVTPNGASGINDAACPDLLGGETLVIDSMQIAARHFGFSLPGCELHVSSDIPVARGLGSSAAAIVAGIAAAGVLAQRPLSDAEVIDLAGGLEGHADNVSASVLGGVTVSIKAPQAWIADKVVSDLPWQPVVYISERHAFTSEARALLPETIPMSDVVANLSRSALLVHALHAGRADLLRDAMDDRLHQPHRAKIFRHLQPCIEAALAGGAVGACLSGAGPAILAFAPPERASAVGEAMQRTAHDYDVEGRSRCMSIPERGLLVSF
jgi:homoserine kinase